MLRTAAGAIARGLPVEIGCVCCNREPGEDPNTDEFLRRLEPFDVHTGVLAGYMLIFGPAACGAMTLLNLHPAAPGGPIGIWQDVIWQLIASRAERSGVTIFRAIPEVDTGPPLTFC